MTELPIQALLLRAIEVLEKNRIRYAVMGGFAVRSWGVPRPTYDADIVVSIDDADVPKVLSILEKSGFQVPEEHRKGFLDKIAGIDKLKVTRFESGTIWDVDLFLARGEFLSQALTRAVSRQLEGKKIQVLTPEDLILMKLLADRRKDQLDVEEILRLDPKLDLAHLRRWAKTLGVAARLEEFLGE